MNKFFCLAVVLLVGAVSAADIALGPISFTAMDSISQILSLGIQNTGNVTLTLVTFTVKPNIISISVNYPSGGSLSNVGSISGGAAGYGNFQVVAPAGAWSLAFNVTYKKSNVWYNHIGSIPLYVDGGGGGGEGKRSVEVADDEDFVIQARTGDYIVGPSSFTAYSSTGTWFSLYCQATSTTLVGVTYTIVPEIISISIYYGFGNSFGNVTSATYKASNFLMSGPSGTYNLNVTINYKKSGVQYSKWSLIPAYFADEGTGTEGFQGRLRAVQKDIAQLGGLTLIAGLAVGGVALVAVVASVVALVVVKRRNNAQIVA